jgi:hypothetical protein
MFNELDVLRLVSERLSAGHFQYMLTGSFALAYYATPRMTRDLDIVVQLREADVEPLSRAFSVDFYFDSADALAAISSQRMFNLMHLQSGIKVDFIVRKKTEYRELEFSRRQAANFGGVDTFIVSREDLLLSKLVWSVESNSEMQRRDIAALVHQSPDTSAKVSILLSERYARMSVDERMQIASDMFDTARKIIESSLPKDLSRRDRRLAVARRIYNDELPEAALIAFAEWQRD